MKKVLWQKIKVNGDIPQPRFGHTFTLISKNKAILFGGAISLSGKFVINNQTFLYDFQTCNWKKINFFNNLVPCQRAAHAACMVGQMQMAIYGGAGSGSQGLLKDQLYLLDMRKEPTWRIIQVSPKNSTPGQRYGHTMVFNKPHLIIFAGNSGNKLQNDIWLLNFQKNPFTWTKCQFENGRIPCPRVYHSAALCQFGKTSGMMIVFGGRKQTNKKDYHGSQRDSNVSALNDVWSLVKHKNGVWDWNPLPRSESYIPIYRYQHMSCFADGKLVIMGGKTNNPEQPINFIEVYDIQTAQWQKFPSINRYRHAMALYKNQKLFVHGGFQPQFVSQPLDSLISVDLSIMFKLNHSKQQQNKQQNILQKTQQCPLTAKIESYQGQKQSNVSEILSQTQPNMISTLINPRNSKTPTKRQIVPNKGVLRQIGESQRNITSTSRIKGILQKGKNERDLTPSRIINSSKNTRLSNQVTIAKGDKNSLQFQKVHVNSLMEQSKKLNNQYYQDSSSSNIFDQGLNQLVDNVLITLIPEVNHQKIINSHIFPLKKQKVYRLCYETSKILALQSSCIGIRAPIKIFGSLYGQHSQLLRFFHSFDYPDQRQLQTFEYLFLGNYIDKGFNSLETICSLMALKIKYPQHIHLLRGKHEDININKINGFGLQCETRLGQNINDHLSIFQTINNMFQLLPLAAVIQNKFLCLNGTIGNIDGLIQIKNIVRPVKVKQNQIVMELLWADVQKNQPILLQGYKANKLSEEQCETFLDQNGIDMIINTKDILPQGIQQNKFQLSILSVTNLHNKNNKACMLKINKNLQVIPQILKPIPIVNFIHKNNQFIKDNQCKNNLSLNTTQLQQKKVFEN